MLTSARGTTCILLIMAHAATVGCAAMRAPIPSYGGERSVPGSGCNGLRWWKIETESVFPPASAPPETQHLARMEEAKAVLGLIAASAERYCLERGGVYPTSIAQLISYGNTLPREERCRLGERPSPDPWGKQYRYQVIGGIPQISSAGPDGRLGTSDDILLPQPGDTDGEILDGHAVCHVPRGTLQEAGAHLRQLL